MAGYIGLAVRGPRRHDRPLHAIDSIRGTHLLRCIMRGMTVFFSLALGCADVQQTPTEASLRGTDAPAEAFLGLTDGTAEGEGLLRFLNDGSTTFAVLDDEVPLDKRAALGLITKRNGRDGSFGTRDDKPFRSIEEVDGVRWIGPVSLARLLSYAHAHDWIPGADDLLGEYDSVAFTVTEAEWTLEIANSANFTELDIHLGLDRRAAESIYAAQPIETVRELSELYYVGKYALNVLKDEGIAQFYEEPEEEEVECSPVLTPIEDDTARDFTQLMALTTTIDNPFSRTFTLQLSGCPAFPDDAEAVQIVTQAVWNATYIWSWSELTDRIRVIHPLSEGAARYTSLVDLSVRVIGESLMDGDFDPADAAIAPLYDAREDLAEDLQAPTAVGDWVQIRTEVDMIECSEQSAAVFELDSGRVQVVHKLQNC
jgi:hypothetical protein